MILLDQCQQLSLTQDSELPSKAAFRVDRRAAEPSQLWWCLSYLHERLLSKGENRKLYTWVCFFREAVKRTQLLEEDSDLWVRVRGCDLPQNALLEHVATSRALIAFMVFVLRDSRTQSVREFFGGWISTISARAMAKLTRPCDITLGNNMPVLRVLPGGSVEGLPVVLSSRHAMVWQSWKSEWMGMLEQGDLSSPPDGPSVLLTDLVKFCCLIDRRRRSMNMHIWSRQSLTGATLHCIMVGLVEFLACHLDSFVLNHFVLEHDCSGAVPSARRRSNGGGQKRVQMPADSIFEVLETAKNKGFSVREAAKFLKDNERLSVVAGIHENATDAWVRRHQTIYDNRAVIALAGATHINVVADGSRHSSKEVLVSVAWSWENQTAAIPPVQVIMPLDELAPGEMELNSLIEKLAQDPLGH